ncbi:hypothetical protein [Mesomycoplasma conjunctivae]|uniref:hypothetical protein n=1 Tax=Mesomycoplasma conjunctivae TaxID=45361 RepID=UPI003DA1DF0A
MIVLFQKVVTNPFYRDKVESLGLSPAVSISLSVIFFILSIIAISFHNYTRRKIKEFKAEQLKQYNLDNPRNKETKYEKTGLFLPSWERAKYNAHIFLALVFFAGGLVFATNTTLSTL